jgi:TPR repeat protein
MRSLIASTMRSIYAMHLRSSVAALCVAFCVSPLMGQDKPPTSAAATSANTNLSKRIEIAPAGKAADVSKEALVFDQYHTRVHMDADGTGTRETMARIRILADAGVKAMAVLPFTFSASFQQVDIAYVRVRKPDGSVVETPDYNVQDMPADASREAPMYSDIHQKHVAVRGLGVGDTLEYQVTLRTLKPEVPGQFWLEYSFEKNVIVLDEQLDLDVPADKAVLVASAETQPAVTSAGGRKLYHWTNSNLTHPDVDAAPKSFKHWKPSVQVTTFTSWEQVGAWYESLQRSSLAVTPAIQAHADSVTRGLTTPDEKLRALSNDVALHVHYVGLDFGIGRYQPHPADDVLANEYGDCKDKHTLLAALLKAAGVDAWPVLISSQRYLDPAVPSPAQFDHVITVVPTGSSFTWIDSTAEVAPIGTLMPNLRDKQALVIPTSRAAFLERTASKPPSPGSVRIDVDAQLSDRGLLKGHITEMASGDVEMLLRLAFRRTPQSQWKALVQAIVRSQGYGGETSNPQVSDVEQIGRPLVISFDYTRDKYYQWEDNRATHWILPPLPLMGGELPPGTNEKKPADSPALGSPGKTVYHADLRLPPGWTITLPKNVGIHEDWLDYRAVYSFRNGIFTAERAMVVKKQELPLEQWERYLAFRRGIFEDWDREALIHPALGSPPPESASVTAFPQGSLGRVRSDSLPVYSEMSRDSDVVLTLARGTIVRVGLSVATGEGRMCNVSNAETSVKLGFVLCDALEMGAGTVEPPPDTSPAASRQHASPHDGLVDLDARGNEAANRQDYAAAMHLFRQAADQGYAPAQSDVGWLYARGLGVPQDPAEAANWYLKAANGGYTQAQSNLGWSYQAGIGVPQDYGEAMYWYRKAAEKGDNLSLNNIGWFYLNGMGINKDPVESMRWYQKAADQGYAAAQAQVGWFYLVGLVVSKDYAVAMKWFRLAADQGDATGQNQVGWIYQNGFGVPQDFSVAMKWYQKSANQGNAHAEYNIGWIYGHVDPRDYGQAMKWYLKAAAQGHATAMNNIGFLYQNGLGVAQSYAEAAKWYQQGVTSGDFRAQFHLGYLYDQGLGVPHDENMARQLMQLAASVGDSDALKWLSEHPQ